MNVTNSLANKMENAFLKSGMLGPVILEKNSQTLWRMKMTKTILVLILLVVLTAWFNSYSFSYQMGTDGPEIGEDAPDFVLKGMDGKEVKLSGIDKSKPVVLVFGSCT